MITRTNGNVWLTSTQPVAALPTGERYRTVAYAAGTATATDRADAQAATARLLSADRASGCWPKAARKLSRDGWRGKPRRVDGAQLLRRLEGGGEEPEQREGQEDQIAGQGQILTGARECVPTRGHSPASFRRLRRKTVSSTAITATITSPIAAA